MESSTARTQHDLNLASRKAEEAGWRRFQATQWLESLVGSLGISNQPSEGELISCLRSGLILCNAINKIQPGSVPKVVENHLPSQSLLWDSQPLPAYQYFENVRNFLVAVEELKLTTFDASVLETENLEAGSSAKIVDCILELKEFHEWKQMSGGKGFYKPQRSPLVIRSVGRIHKPIVGAGSLDPRRQLDMTSSSIKEIPVESESQKLEESIVTAIAEGMVGEKENMDTNLLASFRKGNPDAIKSLHKIVSSCLEEQLPNRFHELKPILDDVLREERTFVTHSTTTSVGNSSVLGAGKCCKACFKKGYCNHQQLFQMQERELLNLKSVMSRTKEEFEDLQSQFQKDMKQLGRQVQAMSTAALGYHKVVKENMNLYNMVQDLKGSIRVYCRIRHSVNAEMKKVVDFIGEDGSLAVLDPLKPKKDGRKVFRFNRVFGPTATQDEVFKDTQPFIRSVMDGYNVCIFAYGQTGSGKTHTMCGPSAGLLTKELGINYLALEDIFQLANKRKDIIKYDIHVQMVEIYNDQVRDLLAEDSSTTKLEIHSCTNDNNLSLPDATMHYVTSTGDVLDIIKLGELNRVVISTSINNRSSRSHSILTVHVHGKDVYGSIHRSCLHLVDLAGSERVDKSEVTGDELREAQYINRSLSCLGDVITALAQKNSHIPYRNSKLTLLLQNGLGGNAKTLMFAHVSPEEDSYGETVSTLKFAQKVSTVELGAARPQRESSEVIELKEKLESLKRAWSNRELQNAEINILKENILPFEKPKSMTDQTPPPCSRRLSIETSSVVKIERSQGKTKTPLQKSMIKQTLPRSRRLSIETSSVVKIANKPKEITKTPSDKRKVFAERTPPRSRRLSIENCNTTKTGKVANLEEKKDLKTPCVHTRARRLSLEGPKYPQSAPKSPINSVYQSPVVRTGSMLRIPSLRLPNTPEPTVLSRIGPQTGRESTNGKTSQIKKSLQAIGKLINGYEKRNQQKQNERPSPFNGTSRIHGEKSPVSVNTKAIGRESLTAIQPLDSSRRTSLGGNSNDYRLRNAKTPPPLHAFDKATNRRL